MSITMTLPQGAAANERCSAQNLALKNSTFCLLTRNFAMSPFRECAKQYVFCAFIVAAMHRPSAAPVGNDMAISDAAHFAKKRPLKNHT